MARKHFVMIAESIRTIADIDKRREYAEFMAAICKAANCGFKVERFYEACGL